ncbi:LpqN/LpqT family lipoprotein [Tsukamurella sp. 8F]|uniref:LpqN/LpqT family lipoprotein n=1 Tax=unclassified Tsukamurella TaxID=2633480 RepID=UPI0023BA04D9|nr:MULTISPECIES: LpqN/LpqT family lipoprotein [unclassified Tsukamurella]MDF0529984.1 LpqN/LpqT family lipoprotein [Tsukamurella sp. 8J]MDF0587244.1 LpqN/LpqT family lipoprotein [Tsukamurella sp. 8F]
MHLAAACRYPANPAMLASLVAAVTVAATASATIAGPTVLPQAAAAPCAPAPTVETANRLNPAEPEVKLPVPKGWHRVRNLDSKDVRLAVAKPAQRGTFAPNAVVTVGRAGKSNALRTVISDEVAAVRPIATAEPSISRGTTCGFPSAVVSYTAAARGSDPARPAKALVVAVPRGADAYAVVVTLQTTDASDPSFQRATATVIRGIQID